MDSTEPWNMLSGTYENPASDNILGPPPSLSPSAFCSDYPSGPSTVLGPNLLNVCSFKPTNLLIT